MRQIQLTNAKTLDDLVISVEHIDPKVAAAWLEQNKLNRPLNSKHVNFLSQQISDGLWQLNGEAIVVSDSEDVLDGQHRLHAVIEAGVPIKSLVVYGVTREAFKTINTGKVRSGSDALWIFQQGHTLTVTKAVSSAVYYCKGLEIRKPRTRERLSNIDILEYATEHPSLWGCAETLVRYPRTSRLLSLSVGTALFEMFSRKDPNLAEDFMRKVYTGEEMTAKQPEMVLREMFIRDSQRNSKFPDDIKLRMVVKAWNWRRRGNEVATVSTLTFNPTNESADVIIL